MNRRYTGIIIGLFAIAALEFGLLGADAAGVTGGGGGSVPPVVERGVIETPDPVATSTATATATPYLTPFPLTPTSPPSVDITGAFLQADPLTIRCDGTQDSTVTVRLVLANGDSAPDGTPVYAEAYNGGVFPGYGTQTQDGYATFSVRLYSDDFSSGPNLIVRSGLFEAGIRIRCLPNSDGECPPSPPNPSPPCGPTPTPTPYPCDPSPGSGPMSPPCATPTPECVVSPPSVSPPCGTPTATVVARTATAPARTVTAVPRSATAPARTATVVATATRKPRQRCADVNGDGRVSMRDVRLISEQIIRRAYDERYDVNGDGRVSNADVVLAIRQLGRRCSA